MDWWIEQQSDRDAKGMNHGWTSTRMDKTAGLAGRWRERQDPLIHLSNNPSIQPVFDPGNPWLKSLSSFKIFVRLARPLDTHSRCC
jgi:hypothetical protein